MKIVLSLILMLLAVACGFAQPQNPPPGNLPGGAPMMGGQARQMPSGPPPGGQIMPETGMPAGGPGAGPGRQMAGPRGMRDLFENLFPPELVMQNQKVLNLTETQTSTILSEMQKRAGQFVTMQWQQTSEEEALAQLLKPEKLDEQAITAQLGKLIAIEDQIKLGRMQSLVRVKNLLTPEQQAKLKELTKAMGDGVPGMDGGRRRGGRGGGFGPPDGGERK